MRVFQLFSHLSSTKKIVLEMYKKNPGKSRFQAISCLKSEDQRQISERGIDGLLAWEELSTFTANP